MIVNMNKMAAFFICLVLANLFTSRNCYPQKEEGLSARELQDVVGLMEDPQRRETFVNDLRKLIQAKEAVQEDREKEDMKQPEKRKLLVIESLFESFESLSRKIADSGASTVLIVSKVPEALGKVKAFFSQSDNRFGLLRLLCDVAASILIALIFRRLLKKSVSKTTEYMRSPSTKLAFGFIRIVSVLLPYGILLVSLFVSFRLFPTFALGHSLALLFFMVVFFYRMTVEIFRALLSPDLERIRILPLTNENAQYLWVWALRFANYTAFYFLILRTLAVLEMAPLSLDFLRGLFLLPFPLMISIFLLQIGREIRSKYNRLWREEEPPGRSPTRFIRPLVRYWPIPATMYCWAVFLFLIINHEKGFYYLLGATLETAITVLGLFLALRLLDWLFAKLFNINKKVKDRFPGLEERTNRYIRTIRNMLRGIVQIIGIGVIAEVWGVPVAAYVASDKGSLVILRTIAIVITLGVIFAIIETNQFLSSYFLKEKKRGGKKKEASQKMKTLVPMIKTAVNIAAGFVGGIIVLDQLGVNTTPILAGAGIVGLAVGFGSQTLVKDLINGLFILFEESIRVGDYVDVGNNEGIVESVGLRTVRLRDVAGIVHVVPNSSVNAVKNYSKEFSRTVIDVGVAYREDVDEVIEILREIGEGMRNDLEYGKNILEPVEIFGLQSFDDSAIVIRVRLTTKPLKQWGLKREFNRRVKKVFDERGIEIPFPHRTIYMGEPKKGPPPSLHVQLGEHQV